jgi:glycerate kinase
MKSRWARAVAARLRPPNPGVADLWAAVEGLEGRAGVERDDVGKALGHEHGVPELADQKLRTGPSELEVAVTEAETIDVGFGVAEELGLEKG